MPLNFASLYALVTGNPPPCRRVSRYRFHLLDGPKTVETGNLWRIRLTQGESQIFISIISKMDSQVLSVD